MKNLFIFLSVFTILFIAFLDIQARFKELDSIAVETPSQVEMKQQINTKQHDAYNLQQQPKNYQSSQDKMRQQTKEHLQNSIDEMNERQRKQKSQQRLY